jgi:capsular polysaccharide biosynthesis protein
MGIRMELTSHEQKILDIVNNHPEILDNPQKRTQIAELYGLSEKTLRNRIAELKKRGAISTGKVDVPNVNQGTVLDLDIFSLWAILRLKKIFIIKRTSAISVLFLVYSLIATPFYESKISLYPAGTLAETGSAFNNGLQGIAESFGLGGISSGQTFNVPDIINSQRLKKAVVMNQWENEKFSEQTTLIKYWELDKIKWYSIKPIITKLIPFFSDDRDPEKSQLFKGMEQLGDLITVAESGTGLIEVSVLMEEPQLAADIANYISDFVKDFVSYEQGKEAKRNLEFIKNQLINSKDDLEYSEKELTQFKEKFSYTNPSLDEIRGRLKRNIESNLQVYITLRQQYELAKIEEARDLLMVTILDEAEAPVLKKKPQRKLIVIGGIITGFFLSTLWAFFTSVIKLTNKNKHVF